MIRPSLLALKHSKSSVWELLNPSKSSRTKKGIHKRGITKGVSMKRSDFLKFRAFSTVVSKKNLITPPTGTGTSTRSSLLAAPRAKATASQAHAFEAAGAYLR